jgi:hypothetical protein
VAKWALLPADDERTKWLILKGRQDAFAWGSAMGLTSGHQAPGEDKAVSGEQKAEQLLQDVEK